ncbi:MAG: SPOR domain-containing protein [Deltaproteobacteria bacterium]|nr:SPOR domain-containing protein [Deltaproteobacteria bacterium]
MDPKPELLVFNRKEVSVIIILLVLVALFSFTLGLRLGKTLAVNDKQHVTEEAPLAPAAEKKAAPHGEEAAHDDAKPAEAGEHAQKHEDAPAATGEPEAGSEAAKAAEDHADHEFAAEASKEKVGGGKTIPMSLPAEKKGEVGDKARYTLQVGSHRTVAEAAEQVAVLKRSKLDAFYLEAKVPGKGTWYRVGVGLYPSKDAAEAGGGKLKALNRGMPSFLVQKINE